MPLVHVESVSAPVASGATVTVTFSQPPVEGELIVLGYQATNSGASYLATPPAGFVASFPAVGQTFRTLGEYYKVAGASEPASYDMVITGSTTLLGFGRRYSGTLSSVVAATPVFDDTEQSSIAIVKPCSAGSAVVSMGYSSETEATPKLWNAGWVNQLDPSTTNRYSSVQKISAGGTETATMSLSSGTNNRLAITLVEYTSPAGSTDSIDTINGGAPVTDGQTSVAFTYTGFAGSITSILLDTAGNSVPALNVVDNRDGTGTFDMPSIAGIISDAGTDVVNFGVISTLFAGIQSDTPSLTVAVAAGYEEVVLAGLETTDTNYLYQVMLVDRTLANGESVYYATATGTIAADGQISMVGDSMDVIVITAGRVAKPYTLTFDGISLYNAISIANSIGRSIGF